MSGSAGLQAEGGARARDGDAQRRLRGWKEIGRHFGVDERTAKRWEQNRGLPVHRVPGEPRASVFAYASELDAWEAQGRREAPGGAPALVAPSPSRQPSRPWLVAALAMLGIVLMVAVWLGVQVSEKRREAAARTADATRLAAGQLAALNDQLDSPPGAAEVREALAREATRVLAEVAASPAQPAALKREAAEGYRRLAILRNSVDRPSLRDRAGAEAALQAALELLANDRGAEAAEIRARVQIEAARQAGGGGTLDAAQALLDAARPSATGEGAAPELTQLWWLARAEVASWAGDHAGARDAARRARPGTADDPQAVLRQLKAHDLEAEALYYLGELSEAQSIYAKALEIAEAAATRWPSDSRMRWALLRQQWNLGSTLVTAGRPQDAVPLLTGALAGWQALQATDPSDEAVAAWIRATRLSVGQALEASGQRPAAIPVLSDAVAERRVWLADKPGDPDRRRMLMKGLATLGDALASLQRVAEACSLYAEARTLADTMARDRQLTGFDRSETVRLLAASETRFCASAP